MSRPEEFAARSKDFENQAQQLAGDVKALSAYRVVVFIVSTGVVVYLANERQAWGILVTLLSFLPLFAWLVNRHNKTKRRLSIARSLSAINEHETQRLNNDFRQFDGGEEFQVENHPYSSDLDIFGSFSIFQLVNRGNTMGGKRLLAQWLGAPAEPDEIISRQSAVKQLAEKLQWRQSFDSLGKINQPVRHTDIVSIEELLKPPAASPPFHRFFATASLAVTAAILALVLLSVVSWHWLALMLVINGLFLASLMKTMQDEYSQLQHLARQLALYVDLFESIETGEFTNSRLRKIQDTLLKSGPPASDSFKRLLAIVSQFDNRSNMLYQVVNGVLLLDFWLMSMARRWFLKNCARVPEWLQAVNEMEALSSLAAFSYANPLYAFPSVASNDFILSADGLGHPLILASHRVVNNFELEGKGLLLVTGSNMSGKSTFLRTVGTNTVLALSGAPVCASRLELSPMQVFTSMRTHDDLEESVSSFYAELRRIRQLLDLLETGKPVLYMLDEVLKGTNSDDRHKGTEALVRQLLKNHAAGFISTHDLSLSKLGDNGSGVTNYSFNSRVEGDKLLFDYKLSPGPCKGFNASLLMKNIGIEIIP